MINVVENEALLLPHCVLHAEEKRDRILRRKDKPEESCKHRAPRKSGHEAPSGAHHLLRISHAGISSLMMKNFFSFALPKFVVSATSAASRPRAMTMRPMRGTLCRASKVYQRPPR